MKERFLQKIFSYIEEHALIAAGDVVFAGVSGGADSMCLLEVLRAYRDKTEFELRVIHVEHGIRGEASVADAEYVQRFCEARTVPCEVIRVDAGAYAGAHGVSVEEAARELRYEAFESVALTAEKMRGGKCVGADGAAAHSEEVRAVRVRIAVAHHMEDQAETVLWQMIRGSDLKGMGGMRPDRGRIIRPLLAVERSQIEAFLRGEGIGWREDATNQDKKYTRNRLRMDVLPVLEQLNGQAVGHLCENAVRMQETEDYLERQTQLLCGHVIKELAQGGLFVSESLEQEPPLMQRRVLYRALKTVSGKSKDLTGRHVALLQELFTRQVGRELALPYCVTAVRTYGGLSLLPACTENTGGRIAPEQIRMEVLDDFQLPEISKKKYTKWFDYDKIKHNVQIRGRRSGDYLVIDSAGRRQTLKSYLVNEKIPRAERDHLPLLADGAHIMWVIGHRISDYYKVSEHTRRVLKVQYDGGNENE